LGRRIAVHISISFPRAGRRDAHNYVGTVAKTVVDALVRAGMTEDDTDEFIEVREPKLKVDKTEEVVIYLEPLEERKK
jgi:Holliday junction resolvase RusA-like endonuclease